jgi:hydrogenase/urease accessory protein HupE
MRALLIICAGMASLWLPVAAHAHEARPLYVEIIEQKEDVYVMKWMPPPSVPRSNQPKVSMPEGCTPAGMVWSCAVDLAGREISIAYPRFNPSVSTLLRIAYLGGEKHTILGSPDEKTLAIPERETTTSVAKQYGVLGVEHILAGYDHLLFLICLLFIAGTGRRILIVITGFTLAHSLTLASAAIGFIRVPTAPIETMIALSVVFLATEIAKAAIEKTPRNTLTWRHPIAVSASFGLLHGFGFASVLQDLGLPQTEAVTALLFFNIGIEIGQLAFIGAILGVVWFLKKHLAPHFSGSGLSLNKVSLATSYGVGILASFWLVGRVAGFPW